MNETNNGRRHEWTGRLDIDGNDNSFVSLQPIDEDGKKFEVQLVLEQQLRMFIAIVAHMTGGQNDLKGVWDVSYGTERDYYRVQEQPEAFVSVPILRQFLFCEFQWTQCSPTIRFYNKTVIVIK